MLTHRLLKFLCAVGFVFLAITPLGAAELSGRKVMIDPGHGGTDPGALGADGSAFPNEEDFVLEVGLRVRSLLQSAGATVPMTRTTDASVSLTARRDLANNENPDAFISIHGNSFGDPAAHGTETFWWTSGNATDQSLASAVQGGLIQFLGRFNRGVKQANFTVLTANPPACLGEMLFISNPAEFDIMNSEAGKQNGVNGFFYGALDFLNVNTPAMPGSLAATAVSATQINLSWSDLSGLETNYRVERAASPGGPWAEIATVAANGTTSASGGLAASTTYHYRVRAFNGTLGFSPYSNIASATTQSGGPAITSQPQNLTRNPGETAAFSVSASGPGPLTYQWRKNGVNLSNAGLVSGATAATLTIGNVQLAAAGFYSVVVSNSAGATPSEEAQLVVTTAPVAAGTGTGLRGWYFDNVDFTSLKRARLDTAVNFDWGNNSPSSTVQPDTFSVRWTGQVQPRYGQTYTFYTRTDGGVRLWINGVLLIDRWFDQGVVDRAGNIALTAGQKYDLRMDYFENTGAASAQLSWASASQARETIPQTQLYRPSPVLAAISNRTVLEGSTLSLPVTVSDWDRYLSSQPIADFEGFADGTPSDTVMFRKPAFSGSTDEFVDLSVTNYTTVTSGFPAGNASARALKARWGLPGGAVNPWLRLTTANAASLPNPTIDFNQSLWFDLQTDKNLRVGIGVRETATMAALGADGGTAGSIEFAGVPSLSGGSPNPSRTVAPGIWTTLKFDIAAEPAQPFTGDGILQSSTGKGVLEHLALVPTGGAGVYHVYVDNFVVVQNNALTFSLEPGAPAGASIHPETGVFSWASDPAQVAGNHSITVRVTDSGTPPFSASTGFTVTVGSARPVIQSIIRSPGSVTITWSALAGRSYVVQYKGSLNDPEWIDLSRVDADGPTALLVDAPLVWQRFYRIAVVD